MGMRLRAVYPEVMRRWFSVVASLAFVTILSACATTNNNGAGGGGNEPPPGAFSVEVSPDPLPVVMGDPVGSILTVTVTFDENFPDNVRLDRGDLPVGVSVLYGGIDLRLNQQLVTRDESGIPIELQVLADVDADTVNPFTQIFGKGEDEDGRQRGKPVISDGVRFDLQ